MPSINASGRETVNAAKKLAERLDMTPAEYRKTMSALRAEIKLIENNLREKDYSFDYSKQPAKAMFKYRAAFLRNDAERYQAFPDNVNRREAALHAGTLMPYELVDPYLDMHWSSGRSFMKDISEQICCNCSIIQRTLAGVTQR
ncbi:MAG: DUF2828 family protein [Anaerovoracaceae bacterium]|nr:DUF2828 family protein [Anaerovoracaceae bacterium]